MFYYTVSQTGQYQNLSVWVVGCSNTRETPILGSPSRRWERFGDCVGTYLVREFVNGSLLNYTFFEWISEAFSKDYWSRPKRYLDSSFPSDLKVYGISLWGSRMVTLRDRWDYDLL